MPFFKDAYSHGNLNIKFIVKFPEAGSIKEADAEALKKIFTAKP